MKKGAIQLSAATLVILVLGVALIAAGVVFIDKLKIDLPDFEKGTPQFFEATVSPEQAQTGTVFRVKIDFAEDAPVYLVNAIIRDEDPITSLPLYDDGSHGDRQKEDGIYAGVFDSEGLRAGRYQLDVIVNPSESEIRYTNVSEFLIYDNNCVPLIYNGAPEDKIDVVIMAKGYEQDSSRFRKDALKMIGFPEKDNGIFTYEPFKSNINKFNFYMLNQSVDLGCVEGCQGIDSLVCCDNKKVAAAASQCPADETIILIDSKDFCGSASSYAKVCRGWNVGQVGTHEFGHIFGGLGDEYNYQEMYPGYEASKSIYPNCDVTECPKWKSFWGGCFDGCGVSVFNRPTSRDCLMYTYVDQFDLVDQIHLSGLLNKYSKGEVRNLAAPSLEKSYVVEMGYSNGVLLGRDAYVTQSKAPDRKALTKIDYFAKVLDFDGRLLDTFKFEFPTIEIPAMPNSGNDTSHSPVILEEVNHTIISPYYENAEKMEVYDLQENKLLTVDLGYFAETCGDGACQPHESVVSCREDCSYLNVDDLCVYEKDDVCDPDCPRLDPDCGFTKQNMYFILAAIGAMMVLAIAFTAKRK